MSEIPIKTDDYCINKFIERVRSKIKDKAAEQLKQTAVEVVQNCVDVYSQKFGLGDVGATGTGSVSNPYKSKNKDEKIPNGTTGLIYGKVQSGKTNTTIATLALAQANQFRCFIVLTSDNTWLGKQTADRFASQLEGGPVVYKWEEWRSDPEEFAQQLLKYKYINTDGVVLVSTKNGKHLDNLLKVLKSAKAKSVPTLIFDDEADNASPNTNEAKQSKKGKDTVPDSAIFEKIGKIREEVANHIYLQITATPQSLLLQSLGHPCSPAFCAALPEPGESYMGGDLFFTENSKYCCTKVESEELDQLKKQAGMINPGNNWDIPPGLRLALCCFFLGSIYKMQSTQNEEAKFSFLAHIDHKQISHRNLEKIIRDFVVELDQALRGESSAKRTEALKWLNEAYEELCKTAKNLPLLNDLVVELKHKLRSAKPKVIDASNPDKEPNYNPGMNILIGGNRLGRGVTIEGLMVTYYGRDPKQKVMDTVHQHARMFGYRRELKDVTRLFLPKHILEDFLAIHEADEGMRQAIGDDPTNIKVKPVWVGRQLKATRSNVLNPAAIDTFIPGSAIFPRDPLWKTAEVSKHTKALDNLLAEFKQDDEHSYEVDIDVLIKIFAEMPSRPCPGYNWEDKRVKQALQAMKAEGIQKGRLYVRRGKKEEGLDVSNKPRPWQGSGFAQSQWISKPRTKYQDVPILVVMYEKGEKEKGWDNQPLYLPTLILPKGKFVFMFNYSDDPEELDNELDL